MEQNTRITTAVQGIASYMGCHSSELSGRTLGELFQDCERSGAAVYWGFWSKQDLDTVYIEAAPRIMTERQIIAAYKQGMLTPHETWERLRQWAESIGYGTIYGAALDLIELGREIEGAGRLFARISEVADAVLLSERSKRITEIMIEAAEVINA